MRWLDLADEHVGIGHRKRPAAPIAGRAGVGARALRADLKACTIKRQNRPATCSHGVDAHHGRTHAHTGHPGLKRSLELAREVAHVGGRATHIETDDALVAQVIFGELGRAHHANDATCWPRQNRVFALKRMRVGEAAAGLHEEDLHARHFLLNLLDIPSQNGRQIGVHHRGIAAADELHQRAHLVRDADLGKTAIPGYAFGRAFVRGVAVTVHEDDGHAAQA